VAKYTEQGLDVIMMIRARKSDRIAAVT
jgi:hypothetical protein